MASLRGRWFWIWSAAISVLLVATLGCDFLLAGIGWLPWWAALVGVPLLGLLSGMGLGLFNPTGSTSQFARVSTAVASCLFLLVVAQYVISIAVTLGCDPPNIVTNCFDDHAAAVGSVGALTGAIILILVVWTGALGGAHLLRRLTPTRD